MAWSSAVRQQVSACRAVSRQVSLWLLLTLLVAVGGGLFPIANTSAMALLSMCGEENDWICKRNVETVPIEVMEVCEACGSFWWNVPGVAFCCRCSEMVFGFCLDAVYGRNR